MGVRYIGGCCGFEPYHIRAIAEEVGLIIHFGGPLKGGCINGTYARKSFLPLGIHPGCSCCHLHFALSRDKRFVKTISSFTS